jgi:hypothetical protein
MRKAASANLILSLESWHQRFGRFAPLCRHIHGNANDYLNQK